jgi:hypothetical protein
MGYDPCLGAPGGGDIFGGFGAFPGGVLGALGTAMFPASEGDLLRSFFTFVATITRRGAHKITFLPRESTAFSNRLFRSSHDSSSFSW